MEKIAGEQLVQELGAAGFQAGVAVATDAEVKAGSACGQVAFEHQKLNADGSVHQVVHGDIGLSLSIG